MRGGNISAELMGVVTLILGGGNTSAELMGVVTLN